MRFLPIFTAITLAFLASNADGGIESGGRAYYKMLSAHTALNGADFAKRHTAQEWQTLFGDQASGFKAEISAAFPAAAAHLNNAEFRKQQENFKAYLIYYANGSGAFISSD